MFNEEQWELVNRLAESAEDADKRILGQLLQKMMEWMRAEDNRVVESSEYD